MSRLFTVLTAAASTIFRGASNRVCYDQVGCFTNKSPWSSLTRPIPLPQDPLNVLTEVIFSNGAVSNVTIPIFPHISDQLTALYNPRIPTFILSHGFGVNGYSFLDMADTILEKHSDANVIILNWGKSARRLNYPQAMSDIRVASAVAKIMVDRLVDLGGRLEHFHLIGHSLGAHLLAYLGKKMKGRLGRLTGLDPAGPGFTAEPKKVRFAPRDALYTEVLHTNIGSSGIIQAVADVDFYFNAALIQPGCILEPRKTINRSTVTLADPLICAHGLSYYFYKEAMRNGNCFKGRPISGKSIAGGILNTFSLINGRSFSDNCDEVECVPLSLHKSNYRGAVIVATKKEPPYCLD